MVRKLNFFVVLCCFFVVAALFSSSLRQTTNPPLFSSSFSQTTPAPTNPPLFSSSLPQTTPAPTINPPVVVQTPKLTRTVFPQTDPVVCFAFMSCRRHHFLVKSVNSVVKFMEEEGVPYELALVEQCTPFDDLITNVLSMFQFEHFAFKTWNTGMGYGLNTLYFGLCTARYIVSMEDDWEWNAPKGWIKKAVDVLQHTGQLQKTNSTLHGPVIGIFTITSNQYYVTDIFKTPNGSKYRVLDPAKSISNVPAGQEAGHFFFAHQGMFDIYAVKKIGSFCFRGGIESNFKSRVEATTYRTAFLLTDNDEYTGVVHHLGGGASLNGAHGPEIQIRITKEFRIPNEACANGF